MLVARHERQHVALETPKELSELARRLGCGLGETRGERLGRERGHDRRRAPRTVEPVGDQLDGVASESAHRRRVEPERVPLHRAVSMRPIIPA